MLEHDNGGQRPRMITDFHAKYFAYEFVRPNRADDFSGLGLRMRILWDTLST